MGKQKAPAYSWYPKDYETDEAVKFMTYEQEGIYRRLLDHQWLHGGIPTDVQQIAKLVPKVSLRKFKQLWPGFADKFQRQGDRLINARLERQRKSQKDFQDSASENGKKGADKRWGSDGETDGESDGVAKLH